jgi:hypothetical protein
VDGLVLRPFCRGKGCLYGDESRDEDSRAAED